MLPSLWRSCLQSAYVSPQVLARDLRQNKHESSTSPRPRRREGRGDDVRKFLNGLITADMDKVEARHRALCGAAHPAGQDHRRFHRRRSSTGRRRRLLPRLPARARADARRETQFLQAARQDHLSRTSPKCSASWRSGTSPACSEYGLVYADPRLPALGTRVMLPPHLAEEAASDLGGRIGRRRTTTRPTASRSAFRAAAWISCMATFFRMKRTWTSSAASISTRAATSVRRSSRASSIARTARSRAGADCL